MTSLQWSGFNLEFKQDTSHGEGTIAWEQLLIVSEDGKDHYAEKKALGWTDDFWPRVVSLDDDKFCAMGARRDSEGNIHEMVLVSARAHCLIITR